MSSILRISVVCFLAFISYKANGQCPTPVISFSGCPYTSIMHRSDLRINLENSLMGLQETFKRGIKYCEVDVSKTKDNRYVLFHDESSIHRTTNRQGRIYDYTLAELQQMDFGSWHGPQFAGSKITTLEEALLIAEKYDAHLYLDCKDFDADLMKEALQNTGVRGDRLIPAIETISLASVFRAKLPTSPWVWYSKGDYPDSSIFSDNNFYLHCRNLGCIAFEVSYGYVGDGQWNEFISKVHSNGMKVWTFTINDNAELIDFYAKGVDGIESDRAWEAAKLICNGVSSTYADSMTTGNWTFNGNLNASGIGSQLRPRNYVNTPPGQLPVFDSCSRFGLPLINGQNLLVMKAPAFDTANGLLVYDNFVPEDYGYEDRTFTVILDFLMPASGAGKYVSLFQTSTLNINDADLFINPSGRIGINGDYHGYVEPNTWNRLAFTVDGVNGVLKKYLNGVYIGSNIVNSNRWYVWNISRSGEDQGFLLFSDEDGETSDMYLHNLQVRNYIMDSLSVLSLGSVSEGSIPTGNTDIWNLKIEGAIADSTLLDYDNRTWHVLMPHTFNSDSINVSFIPSAGTTTSVASGARVKPINMSFRINAVAEDLLRQTDWNICLRKAQNNTAISEHQELSGTFLLYPNPTAGQIVVEWGQNDPSGYSIYSLPGKKVMSGTLEQATQVIELHTLEAGIYIIVIEGQRAGKFLKL